jgi:hypothetical protein
MSSYTEAHRRYYLSHREEVMARHRAWCAKNAAVHSERLRKYRDDNREARRLSDRVRYWRRRIEENPALVDGITIPDELRVSLGLMAAPNLTGGSDAPGEASQD